MEGYTFAALAKHDSIRIDPQDLRAPRLIIVKNY